MIFTKTWSIYSININRHEDYDEYWLMSSLRLSESKSVSASLALSHTVYWKTHIKEFLKYVWYGSIGNPTWQLIYYDCICLCKQWSAFCYIKCATRVTISIVLGHWKFVNHTKPRIFQRNNGEFSKKLALFVSISTYSLCLGETQ